MLSTGSKESEILQLKQIITSHHNDEEQLKMLKEFESSKSLKQFKILSRLCELVPLATSFQVIKDIISVFFRKLVSLLDDGKILQNTESSKNILDCVKSFWSLCSRQQNVVSSSQVFGKWHPTLLEEITPLASLFIDLFISAHGHKEDQALWSKRLYSWLNFDLPDRAIKIALLETESHSRDGAEIAGPVLSQVLQRKVDNSSNADYLLHFLLLKKWWALKILSDVKESSKFLKAPPTFLSWLKTYWKAFSKHIPEDTTLKGSRISQFLLKLETDSIWESLTDVLQMTVFPESSEDQLGNAEAVSSGSLAFVVDKTGSQQVEEEAGKMPEEEEEMRSHEKKAWTDSQDESDSHSMVKSGRKRRVSEVSNSPEKRSVEDGGSKSSSPRKKKTKSNIEKDEVEQNNLIGFCIDRGIPKGDEKSNSQERCGDLSEESMNGEIKPGKRKSLSQGEKPKRLKSNEEGKEESGDDSRESKEDEDGETNGDLKSKSLAEAVLKKKHFLISDPVASSYFVTNKSEDGSDSPASTIVFDSPDASVSSRGKKTHLKNTPVSTPVRSSPRIRSQIAKKNAQIEDESESPLPPESKSTPKKHTPMATRQIQTKIDSAKLRERKGIDSESPLSQKGDESFQKGKRSALKEKGSDNPMKQKNDSTPQKQLISAESPKSGAKSSQKKSGKKSKVTP